MLVRPPRVEGIAQVGQVLQATRGGWRPPTAVLSYQWRTCDVAGTACVDISGANDVVYPARQMDAGKTLRISVTATTSAGATTASSEQTSIVRAAPAGAPIATVRPTITGKTEPGSVLTAGNGTWQGTEPIRIQYRWRRCSAQGGACQALPRRSRTRLLTSRDSGHSIRVLVTAQNGIGTSNALTDPTGLVGPIASAPRNTSPPVISGMAAEAKTLTASSGSWSGTTPMRFAFQWRRCAKDGDRCVPIQRAVGQSYTLVKADVGRTIRVRVTASNAAGTRTAVSDRTQVVVGTSAPANASPPTISGTARVGSVLSASPGKWTGAEPIRFAYQWLRCGVGGGGCASIPGATGSSRELTAVDVGRTLRVRVTATNAAGSSAVLSGQSPTVANRGSAPASTAAPVLSGAAQQGSKLALSSGSWTGTQPITYSFRWLRCDASVSGCAPIQGATGSTYVITRADVSHRLYGVVTARNDVGASSASSNATAVVIGAPVNVSLPTVTGMPIEGEVLRANAGAWAGAAPITFGYQWTRCNATGDFSTCVPIVVTSSPTYSLRASDVGRRILVQVKAQNRFGASFVNSAPTGVVTAASVGTVTVRALRSTITYGGRAVLTGRAVGAQPGDLVTIVERPARGRVRTHVTRVTASGTWTFVARPTIGTAYQAQVRGRASSAVTVRVQPRLQLRRIGGGRFTLRVFAARSFGGRTALVQRWRQPQHRWVTVQRVRLSSTRIRQPTALTVAGFRQRPRGTLLRVVLPSRQSGIGYAAGISNRVRG